MTRATALLGVVTALAWPPADASAVTNCTLSLILVPCLNVDFPTSPVALGTRYSGTTADVAGGTFTISANQPWGLRIRSDHASGRLRAWSGGAYAPGGAVSTHPLRWRAASIAGVAQSTSFAALSSTAATVAGSLPATSCVLGALCSSVSVALEYRWQTAFADPPGSYRVEVTHEVALGF